MIKYLLRKLLGSLLHSKRGRHYRHSSSNYRVHVTRRHSSSDRRGYGHHRQGQRYYKNRGGSSS
ncbi:hypothetical protein GC096_27905 [Paenibacillus sp. LMG 31461]|uniref:Uncharacterized protein n=1 Tax=Paenibacillus plantarum TaxID=2654975 RepID=A0ABX1XH56_9BACL|nr:hypothetical protein [Paenibacillus plantarum]